MNFPPPSSTSSTVHFLPPSSTSMIPTSAIYSSASNHHMGNLQQSVIPTYLNPGYHPPSSHGPGSIPGSANTSLININQGKSSHINPASYYRIPHSISLCLRVYQSVSINHHLQAMLHDPCDNPPTSQLPFMLLRSSTLGALRTNSVNFTRSSTAPKLNKFSSQKRGWTVISRTPCLIRTIDSMFSAVIGLADWGWWCLCFDF